MTEEEIHAYSETTGGGPLPVMLEDGRMGMCNHFTDEHVLIDAYHDNEGEQLFVPYRNLIMTPLGVVVGLKGVETTYVRFRDSQLASDRLWQPSETPVLRLQPRRTAAVGDGRILTSFFLAGDAHQTSIHLTWRGPFGEPETLDLTQFGSPGLSRDQVVIRAGYGDLGEHLYHDGDLTAVIEALKRAIEAGGSEQQVMAELSDYSPVFGKA